VSTGWGGNGDEDGSASVSLSAMNVMSEGHKKYVAGAPGAILSLHDQAKAKGDFAQMEIQALLNPHCIP